MAAFNKFNVFVADRANKVHNLSTDTLKLALTDTAPVATQAGSIVSEIAGGNGYTTGGATVGVTSSSQSSGLYKLIPSGNVTWTASGGAIAQFRYVVLYNSTASKPIGWWDTGSEQNITSGNTFTANLDATNGILQDQ